MTPSTIREDEVSRSTCVYYTLGLTCLFLLQCSPMPNESNIPQTEEEIFLNGKFEAWNSANNPSWADKDFIYQVDNLPLDGRTKTPPIPADYWSVSNDSINYRWDGDDSLSPAEKVEKGLHKNGFAQVITENFGIYGHGQKACEKDKDCNDLKDDSSCVRPREAKGKKAGRCIPGWWGICDGWAAYALSEPAAQKPVTRNGVTFYPGDLEALMSLLYSFSTASIFLSERCEALNKDLKLDKHGRIERSECRDLNPGTFHIITTNFLGLRQKGFVQDNSTDLHVWNHPVRGYAITNGQNSKLKEVTAKEAATLLDSKNINPEAYIFNEQAKRFFHVEIKLEYVTSANPARTSHIDSVDSFTSSRRYAYILEADEKGNIVGGEWLNRSRTDHPDFIWWPTGKPRGALPGGLTYLEVKELYDEAARP